MKSNPIVFWELASHDQEKSVAFFRDVFGWEINFDEKAGFYKVPAQPGAPSPGGGIFTLRKAKLPFVALYIQVDDIEAKRKLVEEHGGFIVLESFDAGGGTMICLFNEPSGVCFAMLQPKAD